MSEKEKASEQVEIYRPDLFSMTPHPHLIAGRCRSCGKYTFPRYYACPFCFSDDLEDAPLSRKGILHSFTVVRRSLPGYIVPYALGLVNFPEGVRVMAQIETNNPEGLKLDMEMEVTTGLIRKNSDGKDIISYKFRPVSK
ncbi:MAG: benzoylsuccinyl-CoA thiolase [Candidatus Dadabacteria bacterium]